MPECYYPPVDLVRQEEERLRAEISDLTALLAEAIELIRYPERP